MTTGVVTFVPADFKSTYPMFATVSDAACQGMFDLAALWLDNSEGSRVRDVERRKPLLYLLTAHLVAINYGVNGQPPTGLVGRISDATEGSVSVGTDYGTQPANAAWYNQTGWGAAFWAASSIYRRFRYYPSQSLPAPDPVFGPTNLMRRFP